MAPGVRVWTRIAGCALAACAAGAAAPGGPAILVGEAEVRPGGTATLTLRAFGGAGEAVQLAASAEPAPLWLAEAEWTAGPSAAPRLDIELSPPADAAPGVYALTAHATNGAGLTTQAVAAWRVLPRCAGAERDAGGACRECPPDRTPNAAGTGCDPCPPGTRRGAGEAACAGCPAGGAAGACGGAKARSWKRGAASAAGAEARPALVLSASPAELTESDAAAAVTVTATRPAPAASRLEVPLTFGGTASAGDYAVSGSVAWSSRRVRGAPARRCG